MESAVKKPPTLAALLMHLLLFALVVLMGARFAAMAMDATALAAWESGVASRLGLGAGLVHQALNVASVALLVAYALVRQRTKPPRPGTKDPS